MLLPLGCCFAASRRLLRLRILPCSSTAFAEQSGGDSDMSAGAIAGIVVGCAVAAALLVAGAVMLALWNLPVITFHCSVVFLDLAQSLVCLCAAKISDQHVCLRPQRDSMQWPLRCCSSGGGGSAHESWMQKPLPPPPGPSSPAAGHSKLQRPAKWR